MARDLIKLIFDTSSTLLTSPINLNLSTLPLIQNLLLSEEQKPLSVWIAILCGKLVDQTPAEVTVVRSPCL